MCLPYESFEHSKPGLLQVGLHSKELGLLVHSDIKLNSITLKPPDSLM